MPSIRPYRCLLPALLLACFCPLPLAAAAPTAPLATPATAGSSVSNISLPAVPPSVPALPNGGFEDGFISWRPFWSRQPGAGSVSLDHTTVHAGTTAAHLLHRGTQDWSLQPDFRLPVQAGDSIEFSAWLKLAEPSSSLQLCFTTYDAKGQVVAWSFAAASARDLRDWQQVRVRTVVPPGVTQLQPRLIGSGPAALWADDFTLATKGNLLASRASNLPPSLSVANDILTVVFQTTTATIQVTDRRTGRITSQQAATPDTLVTHAAITAPGEVTFRACHVPSGLALQGHLRLEAHAPEFVLTTDAPPAEELTSPLRFPHPFASRPGEYLVIPLNEGISYPVEDTSIPPAS